MAVIFVRKITRLKVSGEIPQLKKNQYGHIDRRNLLRILEF